MQADRKDSETWLLGARLPEDANRKESHDGREDRKSLWKTRRAGTKFKSRSTYLPPVGCIASFVKACALCCYELLRCLAQTLTSQTIKKVAYDRHCRNDLRTGVMARPGLF